MIWISSEKEVWRLHKKTVIYLKSVLRQPAQSLLLLLLIGLLSAAFTTRTVEYILVQRKLPDWGPIIARLAPFRAPIQKNTTMRRAQTSLRTVSTWHWRIADGPVLVSCMDCTTQTSMGGPVTVMKRPPLTLVWHNSDVFVYGEVLTAPSPKKSERNMKRINFNFG